MGNFANILLAIVAPTARRLMCDISPCGGGRCFFALAPNGDLFPCSEFIGLERFRGGNLFRDAIPDVLESEPFQLVTGRKVEDIEPCRRCAIRHFCGSPCPAEAHEMNGGMHRTGAFCEFYEEQVRYAFRLIADDKVERLPVGRLGQGFEAELRPELSRHLSPSLAGELVRRVVVADLHDKRDVQARRLLSVRKSMSWGRLLICPGRLATCPTDPVIHFLRVNKQVRGRRLSPRSDKCRSGSAATDHRRAAEKGGQAPWR